MEISFSLTFCCFYCLVSFFVHTHKPLSLSHDNFSLAQKLIISFLTRKYLNILSLFYKWRACVCVCVSSILYVYYIFIVSVCLRPMLTRSHLKFPVLFSLFPFLLCFLFFVFLLKNYTTETRTLFLVFSVSLVLAAV